MCIVVARLHYALTSETRMSTMRPRNKVRFLKWIAAFLCVLIFAGWSGSLAFFVDADLSPAGNTGGPRILFSMGCIGLSWDQNQVNDPWESCRRLLQASRWSSISIDADLVSLKAQLREMFGLPKFYRQRFRGEASMLLIPLWPMLVIGGAITFLLWRRGRGIILADCCRDCGYNLTGNVSGRCPECGVPCCSEGMTVGTPSGDRP